MGGDRSILRERIAFLSQLSPEAADGLWCVDLHGRTLYANEKIAEMLGASLDELLTQSMDDFLDSKQVGELLTKIRAGESVRTDSSHVRCRREDRHDSWYRIQMFPVRSGTEEPGAAFIVVQDVTAERKAGEAVSLLAAIVESSDDAIYSVSLDGKVTSWNPAAERLFGYKAYEMVGEDLSVIFPSDRLDEHPLLIDRVRRGEKVYGVETVRRRKDGKLVEVSVTNSAIRNAEGDVVGVAKIAREITERKRAEEARSRLAAIVDSSDDAIISKDLQGIIQTWNGGAERLFGYSAQEAVGRSIRMILPPDRQDEEDEILATLRRGERIDHMVTKRLTKDGRLVDVFVTLSPVRNASGEVVGASKVARDVTEMVAVQKGREQWTAELERRVEERTRELRATVEEMEAFAHSASHDLRSPLRTIGLCRRTVQEDEASVLSSESREMLERQGRAVERANRLVGDLSDHARLSHLELTPQALDVGDLAERAWNELTRELPDRRPDLELQSEMRAWGDPTAIRFVFQNLLGNALKFSPEGGRVTVGQEDGGAFFVRDEGVGFDMAHAGSLFRPFQRLVRESQFPGTGIGLANVRRIVERHGGRVWAESAPGRGATFRFTLSAPRAAVSADGARAA